MIRLTNTEASAFFSPNLVKLLSDPMRPFPIEDAFRLADIIYCVQSRLEAYKVALKKIVEAHKGIVEQSGMVSYPSDEAQMAAESQMTALNAVSVEYPFDPLTPSPDWPKLTIAEALILRPVLNGKSTPKNEAANH